MIVAPDMIVDDRQPLPRRMAGVGLLQIVRDPGHADHLTADIAQRQLLRQAPASFPAIGEMQFQLVAQGHALP